MGYGLLTFFILQFIDGKKIVPSYSTTFCDAFEESFHNRQINHEESIIEVGGKTLISPNLERIGRLGSTHI